MAEPDETVPHTDQAARTAITELADAVERLTEVIEASLAQLTDGGAEAALSLPRIRLKVTQARALLDS